MKSACDHPVETMLRVALLCSFASPVLGANWWQNSDSNEYDSVKFGASVNRDWLYNSNSIGMKLEGCILGYNTADREDAGCPEDESEDGTTYWYQMANCLRPQAVFSLYNSDSCGSSNFKESFVTTFGFGEFIYYLQTYDANSPFADYGNDDYYGGDDYISQNGGFNVGNLPVCEYSNSGYYIGMGCSDYGEFVLKEYSDQNCFQAVDDSVYDSLDQINKLLKNYKSCTSAYSGDNQNSLAHKLVSYSNSCTSLDNSLCQNGDTVSSLLSSSKTGSASKAKARASSSKSWVTKLKYVAGGMLLVASFVMFTGILFTNRRRRRALMQRKYRQSKKSRSSRSKSRSGRDAESKRSSARSKSRNREKDKDAEPSGIFT